MKALVTGGGGFLGGAIVRLLRERGDEVRSFSRGAYSALDALGVEQVRGDLGDANAVAEAAAGCEIVFHVAAKAGVWGPWREYYEANVVGTENVLAACRANGIRRLVFTSSPSVTFAGVDQSGVNESEPNPARFLAHYPHTKALAEQAALKANGPELATIALRPHLIWGPGDPHLIPRLIERARAGRLKRIGKESKLVDTIYIDNAAVAHLQAADKLAPRSAVAGKAYFLSQGEPMPLWDFVNRVLEVAKLPPVTKSVPAGVAYFAGGAMELLFRLLSLRGEPPMTRFVARQLSTAHWFDLSAARRDFGYAPAISTDEGLRRLRTAMASGAA
ncbi:MAG TPA: NAD-dependent epimerase/dehydratase family protein [Gemmataceae bacterium]|jgi:nucleoside-diphosphate-sugar epimerase|nr:NAD-dependent epimerase/dehydratase family protein [Gemmataceae bacterium]